MMMMMNIAQSNDYNEMNHLLSSTPPQRWRSVEAQVLLLLLRPPVLHAPWSTSIPTVNEVL